MKSATIGIILMIFFLLYDASRDGRMKKFRLKTIEELVKEAQDGADFISIEKMKARIMENDKIILLDVRTEREYNAGHIKGMRGLSAGPCGICTGSDTAASGC